MPQILTFQIQKQIAERLDVALPPEQIKAALTALRVLTKNYEYVPSPWRPPRGKWTVSSVNSHTKVTSIG